MDHTSSTKMKDTSTPRRTKASEKQAEAAKQSLDSVDKPTVRRKPCFKLGPPLEIRIEREKFRRHLLLKEHNRLMSAVKEKETRLKELQESLAAMSVQPTTYNNEDVCTQRIRQLENNIDKMKVKITEAREVQTAYMHIHEHLNQEVGGMFKVLDQKERAVAVGQAEVDRATQQLQLAAAATDGTLGTMFQIENETMEMKREMDSELYALSAEEKELKRQMETLGRLSPTAQSRQKELETEEEAPGSPVREHQCYDICDASESDMRLVEDMEALRETLGCADIQDLVNKVESQRATKERLCAEVAQYEDLIRQEAKTLVDLELKCTELKFSAKPTSARVDKQNEVMQTQLNQEVDRVQRLQAELKQSQELLDTVEQGVNNLYFRMSCVPVEGLLTESVTDSIDKLKDISARIPTLLQKASEQEPEITRLDQDKVYSLLEQLNTTELRTNKRPTTPPDNPPLSDDEEECSPSREDIKRSGIRLIESELSKKASKRAKKKQ